MATNQPAEPSGYDPSKIESARAADARNDQLVRDRLHQNYQSVLDWLHQISQAPPESPDAVNARLLRQKAFKMAAAGVNADIRTPEQNAAISQRIYGDQSPSASTAVDTANPVTDKPVDRALTVASQAFPPFLQPFNSSLPMLAQPDYGVQHQPLSESSRSWTDPHMFQSFNFMPSGDSAPAGDLNTTPARSNPAAPGRANAPAAATTAPAAAAAPPAPPAPAQSSPGFFSGLFKDPYAGMSPKEMNVKAQEMLNAGDEYGANVLTQRADNAMTSTDGSFAQGGSVDENHPVVQRAMHLVRSFLLNG